MHVPFLFIFIFFVVSYHWIFRYFFISMKRWYSINLPMNIWQIFSSRCALNVNPFLFLFFFLFLTFFFFFDTPKPRWIFDWKIKSDEKEIRREREWSGKKKEKNNVKRRFDAFVWDVIQIIIVNNRVAIDVVSFAT